MSRATNSVLLIACGALAREIKAIQRMGGWEHVTMHCLPAELHNTPDQIPGAVRKILSELGPNFGSTFVAYADCGTGGRLDKVLGEFDVERLPGAHCYEFFSGAQAFAELHEEELGTFYLTDFLVRHFDRLVIRGLGIDRHPELMPLYFGNYKRVVYLSQTKLPALEAEARKCAEKLSLEFEHYYTGLSQLQAGLNVLPENPTDSNAERRP
jgi:hypothetical protein